MRPTDPGEAAVRIAFVSQPFDSLQPDALNSVGLVTQHLARRLARQSDVTVYCSATVEGNRRLAADRALTDDGIAYRVTTASTRDRTVARAWGHLAPLAGRLRHGLTPPISTSSLLGAHYLAEVVRDIAASPPDVIHVQHCTQFLPALREAAPRAAIILHAHAEWFPQSPARTLAARLRSADHVITCSDYVRDRAVAYIPELAGRCSTVHNGVDMNSFDARSRTDHRVGDRPFLLQVGAVSPHKGVHDTVDAFIRLAPRHPDLQLRVGGPSGDYPTEETFPLDDPAELRPLAPFYGGDYLECLRAKVPPALADRVIFTGWLSPEPLIDHLHEAAVVVFPPVWDEGFGLPALEGLAAGIPVVATRSGALPEIVVDGTCGYIVDKHDPAALAGAIDRLLAHDPLRAELGAAGWQRAHQHFDWDIVARRLTEVYDVARAQVGRALTPG